MVKIKAKWTHELSNKKRIFVCCRDCKIIISEFYKFKNESRKFWYIQFSQIDWNVRSEVRCQNNQLSCDCENLLGILLNNGEVYILKQAVEVTY